MSARKEWNGENHLGMELSKRAAVAVILGVSFGCGWILAFDLDGSNDDFGGEGL